MVRGIGRQGDHELQQSPGGPALPGNRAVMIKLQRDTAPPEDAKDRTPDPIPGGRGERPAIQAEARAQGADAG